VEEDVGRETTKGLRVYLVEFEARSIQHDALVFFIEAETRRMAAPDRSVGREGAVGELNSQIAPPLRLQAAGHFDLCSAGRNVKDARRLNHQDLRVQSLFRLDPRHGPPVRDVRPVN
jgi:hypothetical protein